jgi:hypothetical protein
MRIVIIAISSFILLGIVTPAVSEKSQTDGIVKASQDAFLAAFKAQDIAKMGEFLEDEVIFFGEYRLIDRKEPLDVPVKLSRGELLVKYQAFFKMVGPEKWQKLLTAMHPSFRKLENENDYGGIGKKGDWVLSLKRMAKKDSGKYDEVVVFIYRESTKGMKIVGHYADY